MLHSLLIQLCLIYRHNVFFICCVTVSVVGSGVFQGVAPGTNDHSSVLVSLSRLFHQKGRVFSWGGARGRKWTGRVNVPPECGVHPGGEYLFTGSVHFGEAWLGCAPRYKNFLKLYVRAQKAGTNPCQIDTEWHWVLQDWVFLYKSVRKMQRGTCWHLEDGATLSLRLSERQAGLQTPGHH